MAIKDRKRTRFNRIGVIRLGYKVFWCKNDHVAHPTRWGGDGKQACGVCGKVRTGLTDRNTSPYQPGHFVLWDAPDVLEFYASQGIDEKDIREIDIMFPFPERDKNFIANYQVWGGGKDILCEGDGEFVTQARPLKAYQDDKKRWKVKKEPGETLVNNGIACRSFDWNGTHFDEGDHVMCSGSGDERLYPHCNLCKLNSMLKVMMSDPDLFRMGYYRISTGSGRNYDSLDTMFDLLPQNVQGIYFQLRLVEEATKYTDENGQERNTTKWFLRLEPDPKYMRDLFKQRAARQIGQGVIEEMPQLEAGEIDFDNGDQDEYDTVVIDGETGEITKEAPVESPPPDSEDQEPPDFSEWKPGKWTSFCTLAAKQFDCFESGNYVWALITNMHGNPPDVTYEEAWTTAATHQEAGELTD